MKQFAHERVLTAIDEAFPPRQARAIRAWLATFYPFQRAWLLDMRRFAALVKCRQIGGSHTFAAWAVLRGLWGEPCVFVSRTEKLAIDILKKARSHAEVLERLGCTWARVTSPPNRLSFTMASGAEIRSDTSEAAGRGFTGNVVLDEFAYHDKPQDVWDAALPATLHGYQCRVLSTPNGVGNLFHQLCSETAKRSPSSDDEWLLYENTVEEAVADGMAIDMRACWEMAHGDARLFAQLFQCVFLDGQMQYFPDELLSRCTRTRGAIYGKPLKFGGIDIGETRDLTVLVVISGADGVYDLEHIESYPRTDDVLLAKLIDEAFGIHGCQRVAIDGTGMGTFPAKAAQRKHPLLEVVQFTGPLKETLATRCYQQMTEGRLFLPREGREAKELRNDMASIKRIVTPAGNVRFDAARTSKGHADRAWAYMLAVSASEYGASAGVYNRLRSIHQSHIQPSDRA